MLGRSFNESSTRVSQTFDPRQQERAGIDVAEEYDLVWRFDP
jgi:hypothetical protein